MSLAYGDFCWTTATGSTTWVTGCATTVPPWLRSDVPLIVAQRGSSLDLSFGFVPNYVHILLTGRNAVSFSQSLAPAESVSWQVPPTGPLPHRSFLLVEVGRSFQGTTQDYAHFLARLRIR
jgi:hypothetical protein